MSKTRNCLCRYLFIIVALCILNLPFMVRAQEESSLEDLSELTATVHAYVSWSKHDEFGGNLEETGSMSAFITGTLTLDQNRKGVFLFFPESQGLQSAIKIS